MHTGVSLLPYALYVLVSKRLGRSISTAFASLLFTLLPLIAADRLFYMRWTVRSVMSLSGIVLFRCMF